MLSLLLIACSKDKEAEQMSSEEAVTHPSEGIIKGKVYFASQENISKEIEKMNQDEDYFERTMLEWYKKGFKPFTPVGDPDKNPELISLLGLSENPDDDQDPEENPISDPILAAFLDRNKEMVVTDTLYHFSKQAIYFSYIKDSLKLRNYLETNKEQDITDAEIIRLRNNEAGKKEVVDKVFRFIAPISEGEKLAFPSLNQTISPQVSSQIYDGISTDIANFASAKTHDYMIHHIVNDLPVTDGGRNWFLHRPFGTSIVDTQNFDRRHRVKVEYWDQNYFFYKSVGVSVRNQTRRLRIWWASKADEIVLGINYAYFKFKKPDAPVLPPPTPEPLDRRYPVSYLYKGNIYYDGHQNSVYSNITAEPIKLPFFKFEKKNILNINIPLFDYQYSITTETLASESNITGLYKIGLSFLEQHNSGKQESFMASRMLPTEYYELVLLNEHNHEENQNKIKRHFYKDWNASVGFDVSLFPTRTAVGSYRLEGVTRTMTIENFKVSFYGMARRGNEWKGMTLKTGNI